MAALRGLVHKLSNLTIGSTIFSSVGKLFLNAADKDHSLSRTAKISLIFLLMFII